MGGRRTLKHVGRVFRVGTMQLVHLHQVNDKTLYVYDNTDYER